MSKNVLSVLFTAGTLMALVGSGAAEDGYPVAGTEPSKRPLGAPVIETVQKDAGWYDKALTGISEPYPTSLRFLEDQGNWYTPFTRPGMTGRYDIRGWHD
jgi:hypothetical protein